MKVTSPRPLGFTLIELLVVIAILGILAAASLAIFSTSQMKGRDSQRKSDLKQISNALEIYYNDYNSYPPSSVGKIAGCPIATETACAWGTGQFTDGKTVYLKTVPKDPSGLSYYYRTVAVGGVVNQGYQLYARLENAQDINSCIGGDCGDHSDLPVGVSCGGSTGCNFSVASGNTTPTDSN